MKLLYNYDFQQIKERSNGQKYVQVLSIHPLSNREGVNIFEIEFEYQKGWKGKEGYWVRPYAGFKPVKEKCISLNREQCRVLIKKINELIF